MPNMNPIVKNENFKYSWLDKLPVVPNDMALVLYNHESREQSWVYLQDDKVFAETIKKWHIDRLAHISLRQYEFQHGFRFTFSDGVNQWVDITYRFSVTVKPEKDAVKTILKNNITDISEPILETLETVMLSRAYSCLELLALQNDAVKKIRDLVSRIAYLKINVSQTAVSTDDISKKKIDDEKTDKLRQAEIKAIEQKLARDNEETEARRKEAEIARKKAETEKELEEIARQKAREEQQHQIAMKKNEVAAEKEYQLQQAENVADIATAQMANIRQYGLENLEAIDPTYKKHTEAHQAAIDRERNNKMKDLELAKEKIKLIKEMVEAGVIDDMTAGQMTQQLLLGGAAPMPAHQQITVSSPVKTLSSGSVILNEDGKNDV